MKAYATFQKWALWIGLAGIAVAFVLLLVTTKAHFINAFNRESLHLYGAQATSNAYAATIKNSGAGMPSSMFAGTLKDTFRLIPVMAFWLLWPNWGATLYGEVRGAKDFRKNIYQMGGGLLQRGAHRRRLPVPRDEDHGLQVLRGPAPTATWACCTATSSRTPHGGDYLSPMAMTAWILHNSVLEVILIGAISLLVFGWWGTVFLAPRA